MKFSKLVRLTLLLIAASLLSKAADLLPNQLSDTLFWNLVETTSEPGGTFSSSNYVSNEPKYPDVIQKLEKVVRPGGVYIGVGPEQNFSYIAGLHPKMAFIVDIRRQNMIEQLVYKALFEISPNRGEFLSRLFSRKRPNGLGDDSTAKQWMDAYTMVAPDPEAFQRNLQEVKNLLVKTHGFRLNRDDESMIEKTLQAFLDWGPRTNYLSDVVNTAAVANFGSSNPTYAALMTATDSDGNNRSFLAGEDSYRSVRDMETRNVIVPVVGDFGGPKSIRAIGEYLENRGGVVTVFYVSNVEVYLSSQNNDSVRIVNPNGGWNNFIGNVSTLPLDATSTFVRFSGAGAAARVRIDPIQDNLQAIRNGTLKTYRELFPF